MFHRTINATEDSISSIKLYMDARFCMLTDAAHQVAGSSCCVLRLSSRQSVRLTHFEARDATDAVKPTHAEANSMNNTRQFTGAAAPVKPSNQLIKLICCC